ncbi:zinc-ribbon domain-containing protein, partial [Kocuria sp. KH4]
MAPQWHPTRNGNMGPRDLRPASDRSMWWLCP